MILQEQPFFQELNEKLGKHPEKQQILEDYKLHAQEILQEEMLIDKENMYSILAARLGTPDEIARLWKQEAAMTAKRTQWLFTLINIGFFIGGTLLTISYNMFHWKWVELLWAGLTNIAFIIMLVYILFWGLLGYEIGKEFGYAGKKILRKTFLLSIIPNLLFMYLIVFRLIPYHWFQPLLSVPFIIACIIGTGILYPVYWIGFRWGKKVSV